MNKLDEVLRLSARKLAIVGEALGIHNLDPESGKIFITGTGVIGYRVALKLLRAGYPHVRIGTHNLENAEGLNKMGAELADFAWDREETYDKALTDIKSVFITIPYTNKWYTHFQPFLEACKRAGVKHIVKVSFYHARISGDIFQEVPLVQQHGDCDDMLVKMIKPEPEINPVIGADTDVAISFSNPNMSYTILYASHLMSNPFKFQGRELRDTETVSTLFGASGNRGVNYVSPNDVAEVAVRVLLAPKDHFNKEYTLTGPEAITDQAIADTLSKYLRKPVMYVDQPIKEFSTEIKLSGDPHWMVDDLVALEKIKATGKEEDHSFISKDFNEICGHDPESFEDYLRAIDLMTPIEGGVQPDLAPLKGTISE